MSILKKIKDDVNSIPYNESARLNHRLPVELSYILDENEKSVGLVDIGSPEAIYSYGRLRTKKRDVWRSLLEYSRLGGKFISIPRWPNFPYSQVSDIFSFICYSGDEPDQQFLSAHCVDIAKSDFAVNVSRFKPGLLADKKYDILISTWVGDDAHKGWHLVKKLIPQLTNFSIAVISYKTLSAKDIIWLESFKNIEVHDGLMSKDDYAYKVKQSKIAIFTNLLDASPRVIPQCLACNVPIIVSPDLYGGKKYIVSNTGVIATIEKFPQTIKIILDNYESYMGGREFYLKNFGFYNTASKLANFVNQHLKTEYKYLYSEEDLFYRQFFEN